MALPPLLGPQWRSFLTPFICPFRKLLPALRTPLLRSTQVVAAVQACTAGTAHQFWRLAHRRLIVPKGQPKIAQRFIAGSRIRDVHSVPSGRLRCTRSLAFDRFASVVPMGLDAPAHPRNPSPEGLGYFHQALRACSGIHSGHGSHTRDEHRADEGNDCQDHAEHRSPITASNSLLRTPRVRQRS